MKPINLHDFYFSHWKGKGGGGREDHHEQAAQISQVSIQILLIFEIIMINIKL